MAYAIAFPSFVLGSTIGAVLYIQSQNSSISAYNKNDYFYSTDITIEGVQFMHVTIRTNESDGKVSSVELMNDTANTDECKGFVETFKNKLTALYGDKVAPSDFSELEGFTVSYSDGISCSVGGSYSANYNKFCMSFGSK